MTDAELLREYAGFSGTPVEMRAVLLSSADHIETLEAALREIVDLSKGMSYLLRFTPADIARKVLEGKDD